MHFYLWQAMLKFAILVHICGIRESLIQECRLPHGCLLRPLPSSIGESWKLEDLDAEANSGFRDLKRGMNRC